MITETHWKFNFGAILIAQTLAMMGFSMSMPIVPLFYADEIGITDPAKLKIWVGITQSFSSITLAIFAPIWGRLADVFSRRAMLLRAMIGGAFVVSLMSLVQHPWQLLVLRTIQGCLTGTVAAATVLIAGITPAASLAFALGMLQTGMATGNSLGPLAGGLITDFAGHRFAFLGTGITLAISALLVLFFVHDPQESAQEKIDKEKNRSTKKLMPDFKIILSSNAIFALLVVSFAIQVANSTANPILPLFLRDIVDGSMYRNYVGSATGIVLGLGAFAAAIAALLSGKFSMRIGYWKTLIVCLALACIIIVPQAFVKNLFQLTVIHFIASFFIGAAMPVLQAMLATNCKKGNQGSVFGLNSAVASTGAAIGPVIGSAAAMAGYRAVFPITALILGAASVLLIHKTKKRA
ncbi:MAG: multidrug efflux MFS transporter [Termitinemataceae bacterium]|nr:MAG: multidrug efflux MFS transporter [Termitinemataceae bacterium]